MDTRISNQTHAEHYTAREAPGTYSARSAVLLIQRKGKAQLYTDDVLRHAGFWKWVVTPSEASIEDGNAYSVVIISSTLSALDISEVGTELRRRSTQSRLLLLLEPASTGVDRSLFDAALERLEGPAALVRLTRRLVDGCMDSALYRNRVIMYCNLRGCGCPRSRF